MKRTFLALIILVLSACGLLIWAACGDEGDSCLHSCLERACLEGPNDPDDCNFDDATCDNGAGGCFTECCE